MPLPQKPPPLQVVRIYPSFPIRQLNISLAWARHGQSLTPFNINDHPTQTNGAGPIIHTTISLSSPARHTGFPLGLSPILDSKSAGISPTSLQTHPPSASPHMNTDLSNTARPGSQGNSAVNGNALVDTTALPLPPIPVLEPPPAYQRLGVSNGNGGEATG